MTKLGHYNKLEKTVSSLVVVEFLQFFQKEQLLQLSEKKVKKR